MKTQMKYDLRGHKMPHKDRFLLRNRLIVCSSPISFLDISYLSMYLSKNNVKLLENYLNLRLPLETNITTLVYNLKCISMLQTHHYQSVIEKKHNLIIGKNLNQKENKY